MPFDSTTCVKIVNVTLHDAVNRSVVDCAGMKANETAWKNTRATETFGADSNDVYVREHVHLIFGGTFRCRFVVVKSKEAKFLFDTTIDLPLFGGREKVSALRGDPHQKHCKISSRTNPNEGWREAERTFRRRALCATHRLQNPS